jgi:hypothetical protein
MQHSHNRLIAILHLVHGFVAAAMAIGLFVMVAVLVGFEAAAERWITEGNPAAQHATLLWLFMVVVVTIYVVAALLFTVPAIAAGFGMLRRRRWARRLALISAAVAALDFPFGTALGVYTFWFLLGADGRALYGGGGRI